MWTAWKTYRRRRAYGFSHNSAWYSSGMIRYEPLLFVSGILFCFLLTGVIDAF